jgi:hypothetical protein
MKIPASARKRCLLCDLAYEIAKMSENLIRHKIIINKVHLQFIKLKNNGMTVFIPVVFANF